MLKQIRQFCLICLGVASFYIFLFTCLFVSSLAHVFYLHIGIVCNGE